MDCAKTGQLIQRLRKEKKLTQKQIADSLGISNKTVSKWECGLGFPDAGLWPDLAVVLGADIVSMLEGEMSENVKDNGNIDKIRFYVCPCCSNVLTSTGSASVFCCGRKLDALTAKAPSVDICVSEIDGGYYITMDNPMSRDRYILFCAYVKWDTVILKRMYPEQSPEVSLPLISGGKLYVYDTKMGLMVYSIDSRG